MRRPWMPGAVCVVVVACTVLIRGGRASAMRAASTWVRTDDVPAQDAVPTPRVFCETPTPGATPTSPPFFPDLVLRGMAIDHAPCRTCAKDGPYLGVVLDVGNRGITASGPFLVEVNGSVQAVEALHPYRYVNVWFPGVRSGEIVAVVDPLDQEYEADFGAANNVLRGILPTPSVMPQPVTCTPAPTPGARADLVVSHLAIGLLPYWYCGMEPELGVIAAVENRGGAGAGAFVVTVNGTPYPHDGLAPAATGSLWAAGYRIDGPQSADVDTADQVAEGDEDNNVRSEMVPVPTLPVCPTGTPSPTPGGPTSTPRRTPGTAVPSATSRTPTTASTVTPESTSTGTSTATPRTTPSPEPTAAPGRSCLPFLGR